ncbi:MAG: ribonuclease E/G [Rhodospirillaceae bacterium]|nr:ribonuclease E/G [Rhodospirillaceae bacterium]
MTRTLRLFIGADADGTEAALLDGRGLLEYRVERRAAPSGAGNIHCGRVSRVEKGLGAAFVDIGEERAGFLPLADLAAIPAEGETLLVQVVREAFGGKGARLTARPTLAGILLVLTPATPGISLSARIDDIRERERLVMLVEGLVREGEGVVARTAAAGASLDSLKAEMARLRAAWVDVQARAETAEPPALLYRGEDAALRLVAENAGRLAEVTVNSRREAERLQALCDGVLPGMAERILHRPEREWSPSREEILEQAEAALEPRVGLPSGGSLLFEPGQTLTAVDVNSGRAVGDPYGRADAEPTLLKTNLEAAAEIARQLRLRNIGGIVVIDFIDMREPRSRERVVSALRNALAADPAPTRVEPMSRLGLVEMTRRRRGPSLRAMLA